MSKKQDSAPRHVRQGDVLVIEVDYDASELGQLVPREQGAVVLAHGEVTGHKHAFYDNTTEMYSNDRVVGATPAKPARLLRVVETTAFKHDEHTAIPQDKGIKRRLIQTEYTPGELRNVAD